MTELRPLVDEYRELEQVAQRLGVTPSAADTPSPPRRTRRRRARTRTAAPASAGGRARTNGRRDQLLEMVKARPGITVREIGSELGVDPTSLYRIGHPLQAERAPAQNRPG